MAVGGFVDDGEGRCVWVRVRVRVRKVDRGLGRIGGCRTGPGEIFSLRRCPGLPIGDQPLNS